MSASNAPSESLPAPSSSERPQTRSRALTALGHYLSVSGLVPEEVVLEWERQYAQDLDTEDRPLF